MNTPPPPPPPSPPPPPPSPHRAFGHDLSPDLAALAEALDRLGAAEREGMPGNLHAQVMDSTHALLLASSVEQLAEADRLSAPPALEESVFEASRTNLSGGGWRFPVVSVRLSWALRAAAAVGIFAAGLAAWVSLQTPPAPPRLAGSIPDRPAPAPITPEVQESVFAMLTSMDRATLREQVDLLEMEADGLRENLMVEPSLPSLAPEGAM
ncbi:MAG: hypothetical protein AB7K52_03470 [Phycisphaerales bacterium]